MNIVHAIPPDVNAFEHDSYGNEDLPQITVTRKIKHKQLNSGYSILKLL